MPYDQSYGVPGIIMDLLMAQAGPGTKQRPGTKPQFVGPPRPIAGPTIEELMGVSPGRSFPFPVPDNADTAPTRVQLLTRPLHGANYRPPPVALSPHGMTQAPRPSGQSLLDRYGQLPSPFPAQSSGLTTTAPEVPGGDAFWGRWAEWDRMRSQASASPLPSVTQATSVAPTATPVSIPGQPASEAGGTIMNALFPFMRSPGGSTLQEAPAQQASQIVAPEPNQSSSVMSTLFPFMRSSGALQEAPARPAAQIVGPPAPSSEAPLIPLFGSRNAHPAPALPAAPSAQQPTLPQIFERHDTQFHGPLDQATMRIRPDGGVYVPASAAPVAQAAASPTNTASYAQFAASATGDPFVAATGRAPSRVNPELLRAYTAMRGHDVQRMEAEGRLRELEYRLGAGRVDQLLANWMASPAGSSASADEIAAQRAMIGSALGGLPTSPASAPGPSVGTPLSSPQATIASGAGPTIDNTPAGILRQVLRPVAGNIASLDDAARRRLIAEAILRAESAGALQSGLPELLEQIETRLGQSALRDFATQRHWQAGFGQPNPQHQAAMLLRQRANSIVPRILPAGSGWVPYWAEIREYPPDLINRLRAARTQPTVLDTR